MRTWIVVYDVQVETDLELFFKAGDITKDDVKILKRWVDEIETYGPDYIQKKKFWGDHALDGEWRGFRSTCFSFSGRIIYRIVDEKVEVRVVRITPDHNYEKKD